VRPLTAAGLRGVWADPCLAAAARMTARRLLPELDAGNW
jgi:hypothetical protein